MQNDSVFGNPLSKKKLEEIKFRNYLDKLFNSIKSNKTAYPNSLPLFEKFYSKYEKDNLEVKKKLNNIINYLEKLKFNNNLSHNEILKINQDIKELQNQIKKIY
jgi:predicted unusual protein kinase regulating ubiquinone biosynthesis (AarF/ABC1/UbiB family)